MARRVFFSFEYGDVSRAMVVRNSWVTRGRDAAGFIDAADFEELQAEGDQAIQRWIDRQLNGTSVTAVLVGKRTCNSKWVKYEIEQSQARGNGLFGIDVSKIADLHGERTERCARIPTGYDFYLWNKDKGHENIGSWVEQAAKKAGR